MKTQLPKAKLKDRIAYYLGRRRAFMIDGISMVPTLNDGEIVLVDPYVDIDPGDLVLAEHPFRSNSKIIKRIKRVEADGRLFLTGDNPSESTDSRTFGTVSIESVIGKVICRLR